MQRRNNWRAVALLCSVILLTQSSAFNSAMVSPILATTATETNQAVQTPGQIDQHSRILELKTRLQNERVKIDQVTQDIPAIPTANSQDATGTPTATTTLAAEAEGLNRIAVEISHLQIDITSLDQPDTTPSVTATPGTASDQNPVTPGSGQPATGGRVGAVNKVLQSGSSVSLDLVTDYSAISQAADRLRKEIDQLEQKLTQFEAASQSDLAPGYSAIIQGEAASQLASLAGAPHGWPVQGPVSSPFGLRPALFVPNPTTQHSIQVINGKGGDPQTPSPSPTPGVDFSKSLNGINAAPVTPKPTPAVSFTVAPATSGASPTSRSATPSPATTTASSISAPVVIACGVATPGQGTPASSTPAGNQTQPSGSASCPATPTPSPTATVNPPGPGYDSTGLVVPSGMEFHSGIDIAVPEGTEVHATADGVVEYAGDGRGGYGNVVYINHQGGFITIYGHNSRLLVKTGQTVVAGQTIALAGSTGYSTGPHVHYEVRYGTRLCDPAPFLPYK